MKSEFSDDSSQSYGSDMSPKNISRHISSKNKEDDCSEAESDIKHGTCTKAATKRPQTCWGEWIVLENHLYHSKAYARDREFLP